MKTSDINIVNEKMIRLLLKEKDNYFTIHIHVGK